MHIGGRTKKKSNCRQICVSVHSAIKLSKNFIYNVIIKQPQDQKKGQRNQTQRVCDHLSVEIL